MSIPCISILCNNVYNILGIKMYSIYISRLSRTLCFKTVYMNVETMKNTKHLEMNNMYLNIMYLKIYL